MSMFKAFTIAAPACLVAAGLATAALAQPARLSDAQYIAAAKCQALMATPALGRQDTRGIDAYMRAQGAGRSDLAQVLADEARDRAEQSARHAGGFAKAELVAERDGACRALGGGGMMAAAAPAGGTKAN
jgi:hypothetical protein